MDTAAGKSSEQEGPKREVSGCTLSTATSSSTVLTKREVRTLIDLLNGEKWFCELSDADLDITDKLKGLI